MRPCNQCGTPVENNEIVCPECSESNKETGYVPPASVRPFGPDNVPMNPEPDYDTSLGQIGTVFHGIVITTCVLIAYALGGNIIAILGAAFFGLIASFLFIRMMI